MTRTPNSVTLAYQFAARAVVDKAARGVPSRLYAFDNGGRQYVDRVALLAAKRSESGNAPLVDQKNGIIHSVSVATIGPALGHGFSLTMDSLNDMLSAIQAAGPDGVKSNWKHTPLELETDPDTGQKVQSMGDSLGTAIGRVRNPRIVGKSLLGDLVFFDAASALPGIGDARSYLLALAAEDPGAFGLSPMFNFELQPGFDAFGTVVEMVARIDAVYSIDAVAQPASNPGGLAGMARGRRRRVHRIDQWRVGSEVPDSQRVAVVQLAAAHAPRWHGKDYAALSAPPAASRGVIAAAGKLSAFLHEKIRRVAEDLIEFGRVDVL